MLIKNIGRFSWSHKYALPADIIVPKKNNWELRIVPKPLRGGKAQLYEGGIRVPFLVRWPAVMKPGTQCLEPVISNGLFPTLVEEASGKIELEEKQAMPGRVLIN